jgi:hypothetical protein
VTRPPKDFHQNPVAAAILILAMAGAAVILLFYPEKFQAWTIDWNDRYPFPGLLRSGFMIAYYRFVGLVLALMVAFVIYLLVHPD